MSRSYWGIVGVGVDIDKIKVDKEKVNLLVRKLNPQEIFYEDVFEDDTFCGNPYNSFGEFLYELDDTQTLTWDEGGDTGKVYFLYAPTYPWLIKDNDPKTRDEAEDRIVNVLLKVSNEPEDVLRMIIDDINDYGCG